jgi:DNA polymerase
MDIITFDFETYYDSDFSLSKMPTEAYVRDKRFEVLMLGLKVNDQPVNVYTKNIPSVLHAADGTYPGSLWIAHNCMFDGYILEQHYGHVRPALLGCTMAYANYMGLTQLTGGSLKSLSEALGTGRKGGFLVRSLGRREFSPEELSQFTAYCAQDVDLTYRMFRRWQPYLYRSVLEMTDMTLRMYTRPELELDGDLLTAYREASLRKQEEDRLRLQRLFNFPDTETFLKALRSKNKFSDLLTALGEEVPMKVSEAQSVKYWEAKESLAAETDPLVRAKHEKIVAKGIMTPALAKTDDDFIDLMNSDNEDVALLTRLRAENNSSLALARAGTFLDIRSRGPKLSVPLTAWGTHTGRYTAGRGDKINLQNMPKHNSDKLLRQAIKAPEGWVLAAADSAQIEARVGAWLAGQDDMTELFRRGEDLYVDMAAAIEGIPAGEILRGTKVLKDPRYIDMRTMGKITVLSSQYGIGARKFASYLKRSGIVFGETPEDHLEKARSILQLYNYKNSYIKAFRSACQLQLYYMCSQPHSVFSKLNLNCYGPPCPMIVLPGGFKLIYPNLTRTVTEEGGSEYHYSVFSKGGWRRKYIYGGLLFNNIVQALSFDILWRQGVEINKKYRVVSNVHDSWIALCRTEEAEACREYLLQCMLIRPDWAQDLPLGAEAVVSANYEVA